MALNWLPLPKYLEQTGESADAVHKRVRSGHWLRGVHVRVPDGAKDLWVNLQAVNEWCKGEKPAHLHGDAK